MEPRRTRVRLAAGLLACIALLGCAATGRAALLYKRYFVRQDGARQILCEPYTVQPNDWLFKLLREKGELSEADFPAFLDLFKRLNPHIADLDHIRPGQQILIPLKQLGPQAAGGHPGDELVIPFATVGTVPEIIRSFSRSHVVAPGDTVSLLIAREFGFFAPKTFTEVMRLFKLANPAIRDPDLILPGQVLYIPQPSIQNQPWYQSVFNFSEGQAIKLLDERAPPSPAAAQVQPEKVMPAEGSAYARAAWALDARLLNQGRYYFPRPGGEDYALELKRYPVLEFSDGTRMLLSGPDMPLDGDLQATEAFRERFQIVPVAGETVNQILDAVLGAYGRGPDAQPLTFSESGIDVKVQGRWVLEEAASDRGTARTLCIMPLEDAAPRTPTAIVRYLGRHGIVLRELGSSRGTRAAQEQADGRPAEAPGIITINFSDPPSAVRLLLAAMGVPYSPGIDFSFPYRSIQVGAVANLVTRRNGGALLVDFGDLYGEAVSSIQQGGLDIVQIQRRESFYAWLPRLLEALGVAQSINPAFLAAPGRKSYNTTLTVPGFLVEDERQRRYLIATDPLPGEIIDFLMGEKITLILAG